MASSLGVMWATTSAVAPGSKVSMAEVSNSTTQPVGAAEFKLMLDSVTLLLLVTLKVTSEALFAFASRLKRPEGVESARL